MRAFKTVAAFSLGMCLLFSGMSCKSVTGSDEGFAARILIYNNCGATLDIFLDDNFQFAIADGNTDIISDLTEKEHKLDAFLTGTNTLVLSESFDATDEGDYEWTINGQATIAIKNDFGETLYTYENSEYLGHIEDNETVTIPDVAFGSYNFEATIAESSTVIAAATIEVTEIKEYSWIIQ